MAQYDLNVRDYIRILRKHRYYLIGPPIILALLTYMLTPAPAVSFKATSSIKISQSATMAGLLLQVFTYSSGDNIATQTKILTSLPLMAKLAQNLEVCPTCGFHFRISSTDYIELLTDPGTFQEVDRELRPGDPLEARRRGELQRHPAAGDPGLG